MSVSCQQLIQEFASLIQETSGPIASTLVTKRTAPHLPEAGAIVFLETEKAFVAATQLAAASVYVVNAKFADQAKKLFSDKVVLVSSNVPLLMAFIVQKYFAWNPRTSQQQNSIHPTAQISDSAVISKNVVIGPHSVIGPHVHIGANSFIGANTIIEEAVSIGENSEIHPLVYIGHHCIIGKNCVIQPNTTIGSEGYGYAHTNKGEHIRIPQMGRVILSDQVEIGSNCSIDRGAIEDTIIGEGTKMDNLCHVAHNVQIGKNCLITAGFVVAGSTKIGHNFVVGGHTSVNGHIEITDNVTIAGRSVVHNSITKSGVYGGHPLQPIKDYLKTTSTLENLVQMRKKLELLDRIVHQKEKDQTT